MTFAEPIFLALALAVVPMLWLRRRRQSAIGHSQACRHKILRATPLVGRLPGLLYVLSISALAAAFALPVLPHVAVKSSVETRDIIVAVDVSSSMWSQLADPAQQQFAAAGQAGGTTSGAPQTGVVSRAPMVIDAAVKALKLFAGLRRGDRIGLFLFDDACYRNWPLTTDIDSIIDRADLISKQPGGGTNFAGPDGYITAIGPLQEAVYTFSRFSQSRTKILVMITDGEDRISGQRMQELKVQLQELGIHLYVIGVGGGWTNGSQPELKTFTELVGGLVIPVADASQMRIAMEQIDRLEKSRVTLEKHTDFQPLYQRFLLAGVALLLLYMGAAGLFGQRA